MTNATTKTFATVAIMLAKLAKQLQDEVKTDPRLRRGLRRVQFMQAKLTKAQEKYELVKSRKVPAKVKARKAKVAAPKKGKPNLKLVKTAAAAKRSAVKRSKR